MNCCIFVAEYHSIMISLRYIIILFAFARLHFDGGIIKYSGVGIGVMWFHIGENSYYRWSSGIGNQVYKHIAIGRMIDIPVK